MFLWIKSGTVYDIAIEDTGATIRTNLVNLRKKCNIPKFKHMTFAVLEKTFKYIE